MRKPDLSAIRVTHDISINSEAEVWDGGEWKWIGTLTSMRDGGTDESPKSRGSTEVLFTSSDDSMRVLYADWDTAVDALLMARAKGRL